MENEDVLKRIISNLLEIIFETIMASWSIWDDRRAPYAKKLNMGRYHVVGRETKSCIWDTL